MRRRRRKRRNKQGSPAVSPICLTFLTGLARRVHYSSAKPNPNRKSAILKLEKIRHFESGQNPQILKQDKKKHVRVWLCILFPGGSPSPSSPWNDAVTILIFGANIIISFFFIFVLIMWKQRLEMYSIIIGPNSMTLKKSEKKINFVTSLYRIFQ